MEGQENTPVADAPQESQSFLGRLFSAPLNFIKGIVMAPINGIVGVGKGIFNSTLGNPVTVLLTSGAIAGLKVFAPTLVEWLPFGLGGKKVGHKLGEDAIEGGFPAVLKDSLIAGVAINGTLGAVKGAFGGSMENATTEQSGAAKAGGVVGGLATLGILGAMAVSALKHNEISYMGNGDSGTKTPDATPASPAATAAKAKA